jgi:hypothetical protein
MLTNYRVMKSISGRNADKRKAAVVWMNHDQPWGAMLDGRGNGFWATVYKAYDDGETEGDDNVRTPEEVKTRAIQVASDTGITHGAAFNFQL